MPYRILVWAVENLRTKPLIGLLSSASGSLVFWLDSVGIIFKSLGFIIGCGVGLLTLAIKMMEFYPKYMEFKNKYFPGK
jgi:hypothetical protein